VEGRLDKIKRQYALLEQPALRDNNKSVAELIKECIAATGENIQVRCLCCCVLCVRPLRGLLARAMHVLARVLGGARPPLRPPTRCATTTQVRRFVKFNLGEGLEKKSNDFAAEVAEQTQAKKAAPPAAAADTPPAAKEQPKQQVGAHGMVCVCAVERPCACAPAHVVHSTVRRMLCAVPHFTAHVVHPFPLQPSNQPNHTP
jgi:elongation factor Ts